MWRKSASVLLVVAGLGASAAHADRPVAELTHAGRVFRVTADPSGLEHRLRVMENGSTLLTLKEERLEIRPEHVFGDRPGRPVIPLGTDVTGDGEPNVIVQGNSGGAHCCFTYFVIGVGKRVRLVDRIATRDFGAWFKDLDGRPGLEVVTSDAAFAYWPTSFADSASPKVVLEFRDSAYRPAIHLMRRPAMSDTEFHARARAIRDSDRWGTYGGAARYEPELWKVMLDLIYSGNLDQAKRFLNLAWPEKMPGREAIRRELFDCQLRTSPYWPAVAELNGLSPAAPQGRCPGLQ